MSTEFSKSHKILDGEGTKNLWKRNSTKSRMSKWKEKQTKSPEPAQKGTNGSKKGLVEY